MSTGHAELYFATIKPPTRSVVASRTREALTAGIIMDIHAGAV